LTKVILNGVYLGSQILDIVIVFFSVVSSVSKTCIDDLSAGIVTYCTFWFVLPLSVICVVTPSIITLPTPSANIGNLPAVPSGRYIFVALINACLSNSGLVPSSSATKRAWCSVGLKLLSPQWKSCYCHQF